jgi:hypothetical protein
MGTELPTKIMLGQTLVLMQMTFLNNVRKVGRLVLSRTSCTEIWTMDKVQKKTPLRFFVFITFFLRLAHA